MSNIVLKKNQLYQNGSPVIDQNGQWKKKAFFSSKIETWTGTGPYYTTIPASYFTSFNLDLTQLPVTNISFYWDNGVDKDMILPSTVRITSTGSLYIETSSNAPIYFTISG